MNYYIKPREWEHIFRVLQERNDITQGESLLKNTSNTTVIADKGYDANAFLANIVDQKSISIIPSKKNRKILREYDKHIYKERHLMECFLLKLSILEESFQDSIKKLPYLCLFYILLEL